MSLRPRLAAWLAIAFVFLFQVGLVAHDVQHIGADLADVCDVCVQLDHSAPVVEAAPIDAPVTTAVDSTTAISDTPARTRLNWSHASRAPPSA